MIEITPDNKIIFLKEIDITILFFYYIVYITYTFFKIYLFLLLQ
jgi:hypothetical protein